MKTKSTDDLFSEIMDYDNVEKYLSENDENYINTNLSSYLQNLLNEKKLAKSKVIKKAELSDVFGYQIFAGIKNPSRDKLVCLGVAMELNLDEIQLMLKHNGYALLYPKIKRDSIIIFGISKKMSVVEINELLFDANEETL